MKENKNAYLQLKGERNYWLYLASCAMSRIGDSIDALVYSWIAYELTGSPVWLTIIAGVNALPTIFITPLVAPVVEKLPKKPVMVITGLVRVGLVLLTGMLMSLQILTAPMLLVTTLLMSISESFSDPAYMASVPRIIPAEKMDAGLALRSTVSQTAQLIGSGLGGICLGVLGGGGTLMVDATLFLFATGAISLLHLTFPAEPQPAAEKPSYISVLSEGLRYFIKRPTLVFLAMMGVVFNILLSPLSQLQTAYVVDVLHLDAYALSVIGVGSSVGMLAGSLLYPLIKDRFTLKSITVLCGLIITLDYVAAVAISAVSGMALVKYGVLFAMMLAMSLALGFFSLMTNVLFFRVIEESYLSRMASIFNALGMLAIPISSVCCGTLVGFLPINGVYLVTAVIALVVTLITPKLRAVGELDNMIASLKDEQKEKEVEADLSTDA